MYRTNIWNLLHLHGRQILSFALLFILLLTLSSSEAQAQRQRNLLKHDKKLVHFGISLGFNSSHFNLDRSESFIRNDTIYAVDSPWFPGFNIGIVSDLHLGRHLDLRFIPTLIFSEKHLRYTESLELGANTITDEPVESIILGFPLYLKFKSDRILDNFRFYILGGGRFDWDLASNSEARKNNTVVKIDKYDFSLEYGLGLEFYFPLFIFSPEIRISNGLPNIHVPTENLRYSDVLNSLKSKAIMISFQFEG